MPIYNMCRICLKEDNNTKSMQPLFDHTNSKCTEIVQRIEECGGIELKKHEEFPKMICGQCMNSLNTSYKFRSMCQASEQALLDAIVKSELKSEPQDTISSDREHMNADSESEIFFDLQTEFINAEEVDIADIAENNEDFSEQEFLEDISEPTSDEEFEPVIKTVSVRKPKKEKTSTTKRKTNGKRGRPRQKSLKEFDEEEETEANNVKPGRGRKKMDSENTSIMCEICGNIYAKRSLLNMHMRRHMSHKPFECEICGKSFFCPSEIGRHMRVHTGEKPYVCKFCGRTFSDRSTNIKHERIHTNERPFTCKTCGKSFTYSNVLKNHMLTHTGEKPFPCIPCNKTFSRKHQLDQHIATITHQQTVRNMGSGIADIVETHEIRSVEDLINATSTSQ